MKHLRLLSALVLCLPLLWSACKSTPQEIPEGLSPAEYFQRAQEASDGGKYGQAMDIYRRFQSEYPQERDRQLWARYEIALLYYKMGDKVTALKEFEALLQEYAAAVTTPPEGGPLPAGPRILAEKLKVRIIEEMRPPEAKKTKPASPQS
jgi:outer membrane protein assembly factor BamD (BamD/ComL family)